MGGQIVVTGLLPTVRGLGDDAPKKVANALARLLWPAYALLVITGFWNVSAFDLQRAPTAWKVVLVVKLGVVLLAGVAVFKVDGHSVWCKIGQPFQRVGGKAGFGLLSV